MSDTPDPRPEPVEGPVDDVSAVIADASQVPRPEPVEGQADAPPSPTALPALGDAIHVAGRSGVVFGACQRDGRIFVTLAPGDDWLPV